VSGYIDPPYFLLVASLLASLAAGKAFEASLKKLVFDWQRTRSTRNDLGDLNNTSLPFPYLGMVGGVGTFLTAGLTIFGFPLQLSLILSIVLTLGTAGLIWAQLGKMLTLLQQGGSRAIDIDVLDARE
jgi:hypothetical protein